MEIVIAAVFSTILFLIGIVAILKGKGCETEEEYYNLKGKNDRKYL